MKNKLLELKNITNLIIKEFNEDKDINELLEKRNDIISQIISDESSKDEKKRIYTELEIDKDEKKLVSLLKCRKEELRNQIKASQKRKKAYKNYASANNLTNNMFSRRV